MEGFIEEGMVLSTKGNIAQVKITPKGTCPDSHVGCPVKALAEGREFIAGADNSINVPVGQRVVIKIELSYFYMVLMLVFVMPLIMLIFGYGVGFFIGERIFLKGEICGFIGMGVCFLASFLVIGLFKRKFDTQYTILKIVTNSS